MESAYPPTLTTPRCLPLVLVDTSYTDAGHTSLLCIYFHKSVLAVSSGKCPLTTEHNVQDPYDIKDRGLRAEAAAIQPGLSAVCPPTVDTGQPQPGHSTAGQARLGDCGGAAVLALVRTQRPRLLGLVHYVARPGRRMQCWAPHHRNNTTTTHQ